MDALDAEALGVCPGCLPAWLARVETCRVERLDAAAERSAERERRAGAPRAVLRTAVANCPRRGPEWFGMPWAVGQLGNMALDVLEGLGYDRHAEIDRALAT